MIAWITKYALTQGIQCKELKTFVDYPHMAVDESEKYGIPFHGIGDQWHLTPESALHRAEEMRYKKIESLKKQIKKLEALKIVAPHGPKEN